MIGSTWRGKNYFSVKNFVPNHGKPITFIISEWQHDTNPSIVYLVYRVVVALWFLITWILTIATNDQHNSEPAFIAKWFIYLTNWGYTACTLQAVIAAYMITLVIFSRKFNKPNVEAKTLNLYKIYWITYTIATPIAIGITIMYWGVVYNPETMKFTAMNFFAHGSNTIIMFVDLWVVSNPIRVLHFIYPMSVGICYTIFSVIYYVAGGISREGRHYIYKILDWDKPGITVMICIGVIIFVIVLHIFVWSVYKLKKFVRHKLYGASNNDLTTEVSEELDLEKTKESGHENKAMSFEMNL